MKHRAQTESESMTAPRQMCSGQDWRVCVSVWWHFWHIVGRSHQRRPVRWHSVKGRVLTSVGRRLLPSDTKHAAGSCAGMWMLRLQQRVLVHLRSSEIGEKIFQAITKWSALAAGYTCTNRCVKQRELWAGKSLCFPLFSDGSDILALHSPLSLMFRPLMWSFDVALYDVAFKHSRSGKVAGFYHPWSHTVSYCVHSWVTSSLNKRLVINSIPGLEVNN